MNQIADIGAVILAAGSSSRLGRPKQLVEFHSRPLLQRMVDIVVPFGFTPSVVVLGCNSGAIQKNVDFSRVTALINDEWQEGMGSSIRFGVTESMKLNESLRNILFLLSDQPFVTEKLIAELIQKHREGNQAITACSYGKTPGVPAVFNRSLFSRLLALEGDVGARKIISQNIDSVESIPFEQGSFDVDTEDDIRKLMDNEQD